MTKLYHCDTLNDLSVEEILENLKRAPSIELAVSKGFWDSDDPWEDCDSSFSDYMTEKSKQITAKLGNPVFEGDMGKSGFPLDLEADLAVVWNYEGQQVALSIYHEDREIPIIVSAHRFE